MIIPKQLQVDSFRFIKILTSNPPTEKNKVAAEKWTNSKNKYNWNDPKLIEWIEKGGNVAIVNRDCKLLVIDADNEETLKLIIKYLPKTFAVQTGRDGNIGMHVYYTTKKSKVGKIGFKDDMGDMRGWAGKNFYTLVPPSIHPNGRRYKVKIDAPIAEVDEKVVYDLFEKYFTINNHNWAEDKRPSTYSDTDISVMLKWLPELKQHGDEWRGPHPVHDSENGMNFNLNTKKNLWHCYRCSAGGDVISLIAIMEGYIECGEKLEGDNYKKAVTVARNKYGIITKFDILKDKGVIKYTNKGMVVNAPRFAKYITVANDYKFISFRDTKEIYIYHPDYGYYRDKAETVIRNHINKALGDYTVSSIKGATVDFIRDEEYRDREFFNPPKNLVNTKNAVINIDTLEVMAQSSDYCFINAIPVVYNLDAKCPKIRKFFSEILDTEKDVQVLIEWFAYCLYRGYEIQKMLFLWGEGQNGKSVVLRLLEAMLGGNNVSNKELQELASDKFAAARLYGKLANIAGDISSSALVTTGRVKQLTGGDAIDVQNKGKDSFKLKSYAKLIFAANTLPKVPDDSRAFFRRIMILSFNNVFEGDADDKHLFDKISTEEELSGLLNWALETLQQLLKTCRFSDNRSVEEYRTYYTKASDSVQGFCDDKLATLDPDDRLYLPKELVLGAFNKWAKEHRFNTKSMGSFTKELQRCMPIMTSGRTGGRGVQEWVYYNIGWRTSEVLF
jgi:putative DNA primase/helicase